MALLVVDAAAEGILGSFFRGTAENKVRLLDGCVHERMCG